MFFLMTFRPRDARIPVAACGYRNSASADPNASVAYCNWLFGVSRVPSAGDGVASNFAAALSKIDPQPPNLAGR